MVSVTEWPIVPDCDSGFRRFESDQTPHYVPHRAFTFVGNIVCGNVFLLFEDLTVNPLTAIIVVSCLIIE